MCHFTHIFTLATFLFVACVVVEKSPRRLSETVSGLSDRGSLGRRGEEKVFMVPIFTAYKLTLASTLVSRIFRENYARVKECTIKGRFSNSNVPVLELSAARECRFHAPEQKYLPVSVKGD